MSARTHELARKALAALVLLAAAWVLLHFLIHLAVVLASVVVVVLAAIALLWALSVLL